MSRRKRRSAGADEAPGLVAAAPGRLPAIDALRGVAILAMIAYHFAFDLRHFGITRSDFENDPFWLTARAAIVSAFLLLAGISLVLAREAGVSTAAFAKRVAAIALCALAVSAASWWVYPQAFIYFGILHCIAVALVLARPLVRWPFAAGILGVCVIAAGLALTHPAFDMRALSWIGFTTRKPLTQDYVPLFPWLGVMLLGIPLGHALVRHRAAAAWRRGPGWLRLLGRHSLFVYMVHQPAMLGALWLFTRFAR